MPVTAIGPGPESVEVELYTVGDPGARWDRATWDGRLWAAPDWQAVGCEVTEAATRWGAGSEAGILSVAEAGEIDLRTYDPDRILDPLNASSAFFGAVRPGTPVRIRSSTGAAVATGWIDQAGYDLAAAAGRIRAVDGIAYLAQAQLPEGTTLPDTLRARVRAVIAAVGLAGAIPVAPDVAPLVADDDHTSYLVRDDDFSDYLYPDAGADEPPVADPPVAPHDGKARAAWAVITDAALDALTYVWIDPGGTLRFTSFGSFPDARISLGCTDGISSIRWLEGIATIETSLSAEPIRNRVRAWSATDTFATAIDDEPSIDRYGIRTLEVARVVPDRATWADRILEDRADAGLSIAAGEVRPFDALELAALLELAADGPSHIRIRDDSHGELVDVDVAQIGGRVGITPAGWRFEWVTFTPRVEWESVAPTPPPPTPPAGTYHTETRTYIASSDALLALTSSGGNLGAGAASSLPVGAWSGWTYRSAIAFPAIPTSGVRRLTSATLKLTTSTQVRVGFGAAPTIEIRRITGAWSAGSASTPSSSNAVVYPGPATSSSGAKRTNVTTSEGAAVSIRVDDIARAWFPAAAGGLGAVQRGVMLLPGSGSGSDTSEFWPLEHGGSARPSLELVLEVFD